MQGKIVKANRELAEVIGIVEGCDNNQEKEWCPNNACSAARSGRIDERIERSCRASKVALGRKSADETNERLVRKRRLEWQVWVWNEMCTPEACSASF